MKNTIRILLFFGIFAWACRPPPKPVPPPKKVIEPCDVFETQVDEVWNDDVLEALNLTVKVYTGDLDALDAEQIVAKLDAFCEKWMTLRQTACEKHNESDSPSDEPYTQIVECLETALSNLKRRIIELENNDLTGLQSILIDLNNCS